MSVNVHKWPCLAFYVGKYDCVLMHIDLLKNKPLIFVTRFLLYYCDTNYGYNSFGQKQIIFRRQISILFTFVPLCSSPLLFIQFSWSPASFIRCCVEIILHISNVRHIGRFTSYISQMCVHMIQWICGQKTCIRLSSWCEIYNSQMILKLYAAPPYKWCPINVINIYKECQLTYK